jgi:hypothetical protein
MSHLHAFLLSTAVSQVSVLGRASPAQANAMK